MIGAAARILEQHPFVAGPWANRLAQPQPDSVSRAERLFVLATQWPDEVRVAPWSQRYHHADWHYVNLRYAAGTNHPGPVLAGRLLEELEANLKIVQDTNADDAQRAIALCWLFHAVGDLHQPLHVTALVSRKFPLGDRGGNEFYVRPASGEAPYSLHSLWDSYGVKHRQDFVGVQDNARHLISAHPRSSLAELSLRPAAAFGVIAREESFALAVAWAYRNGKLKGVSQAEAASGKAKTLPAQYSSDAEVVAARRLAVAGYRIADLLRATFGSQP